MSLDSHYNCDCRHHSCSNNAAVASAGCLRKMNCELVICYMLYNYNHKQQTQANMIKHEGKTGLSEAAFPQDEDLRIQRQTTGL